MPKPQEVVTFKVDAAMLELMQGVGNRSAFIRNALLAAMGHLCPLCNGTGLLTPRKKEHWKKFSKDHRLKACRHCHELTIVCKNA